MKLLRQCLKRGKRKQDIKRQAKKLNHDNDNNNNNERTIITQTKRIKLL